MRRVIFLALMLWGGTAFSEEIIQPGDLLGISVYKNPDLSLEVSVASGGNINYPLVGQVNLGGKSTVSAAAKLEEQLVGGGYVKDPQVIINIISSKARTVSVLGYVRAPGKYQIDVGADSVIDFVALAGGLLPTASNTISVIHREGSGTQNTKLNLDKLFKLGDADNLQSKNLKLKPGDIVYIPKNPVFYVYGEVNRPGSFVLEEGMTVMQAISLGGGISPRGSDSSLVVHRKDESGKLIEIDVSGSSEVLENDVIYVEESFF